MEVWTRGDEGWAQTIHHAEAVELASIGARLDVSALYEAATQPG